ncbi:WD domain, G-beta repeat, putative [Leishmania guyanensis]
MSYSAYQVAGSADPLRPTLEMCFRGHRQGVCSVDFQPTLSPSPLIPEVASGGADGAVMLWNAKATTRTMRFMGHRGPVLAVACSPRAKLLASGGYDGYVRLWIPNTRRTTATYGLHAESLDDRNSCGWRGHTGAARVVVFAQDVSDYLYTAGNDKTVKCWDLNYASSSQHIGVGPGNKFVGSFAAPSSTGQHGTGHMNWVRTVAVQSAYTSSSFFHYLASGGDDHAICVWDTRTRAPVHILFDCRASVHSLSFHPDGYVLASGDASGAINIFDLRRVSSMPTASTTCGGSPAPRRFSTLLQHYRDAHAGGVQCVDFAPNGGWLLSAGNDSTAKLWDVKQVYLYCTVHGHEGPVKSCRFSEDGRWFATGGGADKTVLVWRSGLAEAVAGCDSTAETTLAIGKNAALTAVTPSRKVCFSGDAPALQFSSSMTQLSRNATQRCKLQGDSLPRCSGVSNSPKTSASQSGGSGTASSCRGGSGCPNVNVGAAAPAANASVAVKAATSLGRPPLPLSLMKKEQGASPPEPFSRDNAHFADAKVSDCKGEKESSVVAHDRSFVRSDYPQDYLVASVADASGEVGNNHSLQQPDIEHDTASGGTNTLHQQEAPLDGISSSARSAVIAAEEREQEVLVAQERAYQRLQEERIIQQRLANLEEALASLATYMQSQHLRQAKEIHDTRMRSRSQADKYDADLADLKCLIARLAVPAADMGSANATSLTMSKGEGGP